MKYSTNKLNLVPAIREVEAQIHELEAKFNDEVKPYRDSLKALRKINQVCERCNGEGKVLRSRACAEDDRPDPDDPSDYITCPVCHGTGLSKGRKTNERMDLRKRQIAICKTQRVCPLPCSRTEGMWRIVEGYV